MCIWGHMSRTWLMEFIIFNDVLILFSLIIPCYYVAFSIR